MPMFVSGPKKQKPAGVNHPGTHARTHTHICNHSRIKLETKELEI